MLTLGLSKKWEDKMKSLPESGMGYQNVAVKLKNGVVLKGIVTNSAFMKSAVFQKSMLHSMRRGCEVLLK